MECASYCIKIVLILNPDRDHYRSVSESFKAIDYFPCPRIIYSQSGNYIFHRDSKVPSPGDKRHALTTEFIISRVSSYSGIECVEIVFQFFAHLLIMTSMIVKILHFPPTMSLLFLIRAEPISRNRSSTHSLIFDHPVRISKCLSVCNYLIRWSHGGLFQSGNRALQSL